MSIDIKTSGPGISGLNKLLKKAKKTDVLVGIPQARASRQTSGEKANNAELLFIHTNGSPLRHIPARPVIEPALSEKTTRYSITQQFKLALQALFDGDQEMFKTCLSRAGMLGQNAARKWFVNPNNGWAPNSPSTIQAKGSDMPLIDTGEMRKAITYIVRE